MNSDNHQFKNFLIVIIVVVGLILYFMINPSLFGNIQKKGALKLSSQKPWQEELEDEDDTIDDVDIHLEYPENEFKKEEANNPFEKFNKEEVDEYWVTGSVPINPMTDLNYKKRSEIYQLRKNYVEKTIFKNRNCVPTEEVFGQIVDKKPWLSIEALTCTGRGVKANIGLSEESRYINNPTMLVGLDRLSFDDKDKKDCTPVDYLIPIKINYSKDENTIKVIFEVSAYRGNLGHTFLLKGLNARDLGFKFAYADVLKNTVFTQKENVSTNIYAFKDFIHLGNACGVQGGCNNGSPLQNELKFTTMAYPATIHMKLWKKMPKNKDVKPDINYLIILR